MNYPVRFLQFPLSDWYTGPEKSFFHRYSYVQAVSRFSGYAPYVFWDGKDFIVLVDSLWCPNTYDLLGPRTFIRGDLSRLVKWSIETGKAIALQGIDGQNLHPSLRSISCSRIANVVHTSLPWEAYLANFDSKSRWNIKKTLSLFQVEQIKGFDKYPEFQVLLNEQEKTLEDRYWSSLDPELASRQRFFWRPNILELCSQFSDVAEYSVAHDKGRAVAASFTITLDHRCYAVCSFWDTKLTRAGLCVLAHSLKRSCDSSDVYWFDIMGGMDEYKSQFLPDKNWLEYGCMALPRGSSLDKESIAPFIYDGRFVEKISISEIPLAYR